MKKFFLIADCIGIVSLIIFIYCLTVVISKTTNDTPLNEIGEQFIFEKDTVMVVNYSSISQNYTLSNGREVDQRLIKKLTKVK